MWLSKLCTCRSAITPLLTKSSKYTLKTVNSLNVFTQHVSKRCYKVPTSKRFKSVAVESLTKATEEEVTKCTPFIRKQIGFWLVTCSGMVYLAITLGGYTRLTESGLSMVTWRFTYESMPQTVDEWEAEFKKYQEYPEFKQLKQDITLEEFQSIWMTEYIHRYWGRAVGVCFLFPAAFFWYKGYFSGPMQKRVAIFAGLIAAQGLMGWHMVKSGLEDRFHEQTDVPRVSQYRLAAHLGLALTLYSGLFWSALDMLFPSQTISVAYSSIKKLKMLTHSCKGLIFLTALSGAFVAGLDAGLVYNSFPKMGGKWIPDDILALSPMLKNFTENATTVQFDHRILGITTLSMILATFAVSRKIPLTPRAQILTYLLPIAALAQVGLGISTLVHHVPVTLASLHQSTSVLMLTIAIWLSHELKRLKHIPK